MLVVRDRDEWRYRSAEGFIAEGEVLEEIVAKDKDSMALIGYDKESLASLIRNAMIEADKTVQDRYNLPFSIALQGKPTNNTHSALFTAQRSKHRSNEELVHVATIFIPL